MKTMKINIVLAVLVILTNMLKAQTPSYQVIAMNDVVVNSKTIEFDIYILRTSEEPLELANFQTSLYFDNAIKSNGTLTAQYIEGKSELSNSHQYPNPPNVTGIVGEYGQFRIAAKMNPGTGNGSLISNVYPGTRFGRFRITNTVDFAAISPNFRWNFERGGSHYFNVISAYINNEATDITNPELYINQLNNTVLDVETEIKLPTEYGLSDNYPNPFNPTTRIDYQLPFDSKVTIELYGITGEKMVTLINSEQSAGYYNAEINAGKLNLSSGVYLYKMTAQSNTEKNFVQTKKLVLMK